MAVRGRGRPPKPTLYENIELVLRRGNMRLERRTGMLDNGSLLNEHWLVNTDTGERTRVTKAKGRAEIEKIGQGTMFDEY